MSSRSASTPSASCCSSIIQPRTTSCRTSTSGDSREMTSTSMSSDGTWPALKPWWMLYVMTRNVPGERGSDGACDRGGDATRIAPRKSERAGSEAEPDEHHAELRRAGGLGAEPKAARERDLRAVRGTRLRHEKQGRQTDEREPAPEVRPRPRACPRHSGDTGREKDERGNENKRSGERGIHVYQRDRAKRRAQHEVGAERERQRHRERRRAIGGPRGGEQPEPP